MSSVNFKYLVDTTKDENNLIKYFYNMSYSMKQLHDAGYYISDFRADKIFYDEEKGEFVFEVNNIRPDVRKEIVKTNIVTFASLVTNIYLNKNNLFDSNILLPPNYMKTVIDNFEYAYSTEDYGYFCNLYKNDDIIYYHEFIDKKKETEVNSNSSNKNKNMVKSTTVGALLSEKEENKDYMKAAFISVPVVMIMSALLIFIMIVIYIIAS